MEECNEKEPCCITFLRRFSIDKKLNAFVSGHFFHHVMSDGIFFFLVNYKSVTTLLTQSTDRIFVPKSAVECLRK